MRVILLLAFFAMSCSAATMEDKKMENAIHNKIADAVHVELGWKTDEVRVDEVDRLRRDSCSFFTAAHKVRPLSYQLNYAVLKGEDLIKLADEKAVSKILNACGSDASPAWWAEIVTRFHEELGSGIVLTDPNDTSGAVDKIRNAKKEFASPTFSKEPGAKIVTFYVLEPESYTVYWVKASLKSDGSVAVSKTEIG
jgi:hypothetical protein